MSSKKTTQQLWDEYNIGSNVLHTLQAVELKKAVALELFDRVMHGEEQPNWTPQTRKLFLDVIQEYQNKI